MKKIFRLFIVIAAFASCSKTLDKKPVSSLVEEEFYRDTEEVELGVIGMYGALRPVYNYDYLVVGLRSDDGYVSDATSDSHQLDQFSNGPTNSMTSGYWQRCYFVIRQANTVIKYLSNVSDPELRDYFEGEAKFVRAHMHFNLVRLFGEIPLLVSSPEYDEVEAYQRVDTVTVYNQIQQDLLDAISKLPSSWSADQAGRVTQAAAKAMLAKVYMTQYKWAEARPLLQDLIDNPGPYTLLPVFDNIFGVANEMNAEIMYAVRYKSGANGLGNDFSYNTIRQSGSIGLRAYNDLIKAYTSADQRKTISVGTQGYTNKYLDPGPLEGDGGADFIILRYADVLLMYAEVVNELEGTNTSTSVAPAAALTQFNRVRTRAGLTAYTQTNTQVKTKDAFRTTIKLERRLEFAQEDQRWFDLVRWGDAVTAMNAHFTARNRPSRMQPYQRLYPIPQREIDISNGAIPQNPGY